MDNSFVLSINQKRLDFFYNQLKLAGFTKLPKHVQGMQLNKCKYFNDNVKCRGIVKTHISVMESHYMIVSMAKALNLPFVCIFEEDAVGCIGVKDRLRDILNQIPEDADIFILGNINTFGVKIDLGSIVVPTKTFGTQSYIVFHKNYDYFLDKISQDITSGLCNYGQNVYMAKDILFCQYSIDGSLNQEWSKNRLGFMHNSLSKDYIDKHFKIIS